MDSSAFRISPGRHSTAAFFFLTFAFTWGLQLPAVMAQRGLLPVAQGIVVPLAGLGMLGPLSVATVLTHREGGSEAVRKLYGRLMFGVSLTLTKLYNASGGSLLLCVLAHFALHLNNSHRALPGDVVPLLAHAIVYAALGLLLMRPELSLGRGRRGSVQVFDEMLFRSRTR